MRILQHSHKQDSDFIFVHVCFFCLVGLGFSVLGIDSQVSPLLPLYHYATIPFLQIPFSYFCLENVCTCVFKNLAHYQCDVVLDVLSEGLEFMF
jgi:bacteriorhodopsin